MYADLQKLLLFLLNFVEPGLRNFYSMSTYQIVYQLFEKIFDKLHKTCYPIFLLKVNLVSFLINKCDLMLFKLFEWILYFIKKYFTFNYF
jgi:hypothetical protein